MRWVYALENVHEIESTPTFLYYVLYKEGIGIMTTLQYRRGKEVKVQKNRGERTVLM
jgi:hypothetical protein